MGQHNVDGFGDRGAVWLLGFLLASCESSTAIEPQCRAYAECRFLFHF